MVRWYTIYSSIVGAQPILLHVHPPRVKQLQKFIETRIHQLDKIEEGFVLFVISSRVCSTQNHHELQKESFMIIIYIHIYIYIYNQNIHVLVL